MGRKWLFHQCGYRGSRRLFFCSGEFAEIEIGESRRGCTEQYLILGVLQAYYNMLIVRETAGLGMMVLFVLLDSKANLFPSRSHSPLKTTSA